MKLLTGLLLLVAASAQTETIIPKTPAGQVLQAWLDAFNSGDRSKIAAYLNQYEPQRTDRLDQTMSFRAQTGGFTLIRIEKSDPLSIEAIVKEREGDNNGRLTLEIAEGDPPIVKHLRLNVVPRSPGQPGPDRLSFPAALESLEGKASELAAKDQFSGCVLVGRGGKIVFQKAYGLADREKHVGNRVDTKFRIGSMNKMFTATAILQLVGEGKLDLDAPLGKYLPDYPNHDLAAKVTIRNLLTHTGGTGDIFTPEYEKQRLETRELSDYVKLFGARALEFEPGSTWAYSNYGFVLLGVVVEKVSGVSYYEYVRQNIFAKAGMKDTGSLPEADHVPLLSTGYLRKDAQWVTNADTLPWRASSAGGGYSTVGDLFRFAQALSAGKLIKPELFAQMTSSQEGAGKMPPGMHYGFGMSISEGPQGARFGHGGGAPGMNGELRIYPKTHTVVAVLANLDPPAATRVADFFEERMPVD
jgi:CubicO group peptidase (beta-lactamase class C family)